MHRSKSEPELQPKLQELQSRGVDAIRVTFPDIHGIPRGKDVPVASFAQLARDGMAFCAASLVGGLAINVAGYPAEPTYPDMRIRLLPDTVVQVPWEPATAWCIGEVDPADDHRGLCPRGVLGRAVAALADIGLTASLAPELEFYLVKRRERGDLIPAVDGLCMVYTMGDCSDPSGVVRTLLRHANQFGLDASTAHHECGRGQYEINLNHAEAISAADRAFRLKNMVKEFAARQGLWATFMAKPFADDAGSGCHLHISLADDRGNRFFDPDAENGLSRLAHQFLAGILAHAPALTALFSPTINSYKRMLPGTLVPVVANWGWDNRNTYVRVPAERGPATRLELRAADAAANPYLVIAASLFAGLDGIKRKLEPPTASKCGAAERIDASPLPCCLEDSLQALQDDCYLRDVIGSRLVDAFVSIKMAEAERFRRHVTDWEVNEYAWHL